MANPKIEVEVSSNIDQLKKGFSDSEAAVVAFGNKIAEIKKKFDSTNGVIQNLQTRLGQLKKNLESATDIQSIAKYNIRISQTEEELKRLSGVGLQAGNALKTLPGSLNGAANSVNKLQRATSTYNGVGIEFSRIIQDAPFGIIGVGNNITQLASTFQQLRVSSTSTGAALKTAFASIISPANLLVLGISAVTTLLTLYQMGTFDAKEGTEDLKKEVDVLKQSLDNMAKSLGAVDTARLKGIQSAEDELSKVNLLISVIDDETLSRERRISAFNELQKIQPAFFGGITAEEALIKGLTKEYNALTTAIFAKASATAIEKKAGELAIKNIDLLERERQETDLQNNLLEKKAGLTSEISKIQSIIAKEFGKGSTSSAGFSEALVRNRAELALVNGELETLGIVSTLTNDALIDNGKSTELLKDAYKNTALELGGLLTVTKDVVTETQKLTRTFDDIASLPILAPRDNPFAGGLPTPVITQGVQTDPTAQMKESIAKGKEVLANGFSEVRAQAEEFNNMITETLTNGISNAVTELAFSIGEALATGDNVFSAIGKSLLNSIGSFLGELGAQLIQVGVAGLAFATLLETIKNGGPAAIPAAIAAIGIGVALTVASGAFRGIAGKGLSGGSGGGGGGSVGSGVSGQSFTGGGVGGLGGGSKELTGELVVRGNDLVYVLGQSQNKITKG